MSYSWPNLNRYRRNIMSKNIKFKILPSINASLSDLTGFFALKTNQKIAIFVWIFTCVDFSPKDYNQSLQKSRTVPPDIVTSLVCRPLKPPQSFKPKNVIETGFFVFLWILPKPVRGSQREENFQNWKRLWKPKKILRVSVAIFTCFQFSLTVLLFLPHVCFIYKCHG